MFKSSCVVDTLMEVNVSFEELFADIFLHIFSQKKQLLWKL